MTNFNENDVEQASLGWLRLQGYETFTGSEMDAERNGLGDIILQKRLRESLRRLNPEIQDDVLDEAERKILYPDSTSIVANNHILHKYFVEGVSVEFQRQDGSMGGDLVKIFDFDNPENNEFLAVNQFTVIEDRHECRPDIIVFVNGLPITVIELKNAESETQILNVLCLGGRLAAKNSPMLIFHDLKLFSKGYLTNNDCLI